ncbi:MAG: hypothetical protein L0K27_02720 [Corynebacterium nuruki]|nr:hypothetical protein [Corynebacterium nuruki]
MTDITDQDRRDALAFAREIPNLVSPHTGAAAAARVILATVDAPAPTLTEELRNLGALLEEEGGAGAKSTCWARDLANYAGQIEQERDQAREDAARIADERDRSDAQAQGLRMSILDLHIEVEELTARVRTQQQLMEVHGVPRDTVIVDPSTDERMNVSVFSKSSTPAPADVIAGEPWLVEVEGKTVSAMRMYPASTRPWIVPIHITDAGLPFHWVSDDAVRLVDRLVPEAES